MRDGLPVGLGGPVRLANARVVDPASGLDAVADVVVQDGRIAAIVPPRA